MTRLALPILCLWVFLAQGTLAQPDRPVVVRGELPVADGRKGDQLVPAIDSIPVFTVPELVILERFPSKEARRKAERRMRKFTRLEQKVRKVYPLAKACGKLIRQVDREFAGMEKARDQKLYAKRLQKVLFDEYEPIIRKLTLSEGKILLKLIDRETGTNAYELIKNYRSGATAVFWQTVAKIFKADLKTNYNPEEEFAIETILYYIDQEERGLRPRPTSS